MTRAEFEARCAAAAKSLSDAEELLQRVESAALALGGDLPSTAAEEVRTARARVFEAVMRLTRARKTAV